jgi:hypothetical protein
VRSDRALAVDHNGGEAEEAEGAPAAAAGAQARGVHARAAPGADGGAPGHVRRAHPVPASGGGAPRRRARGSDCRRKQGYREVLPRLRSRWYHPRRGEIKIYTPYIQIARTCRQAVFTLFLMKQGCGASDPLCLGGCGAGERRPLDPEHQARHPGALWPALRHRQQVLLRLQQVRRHAGGAAGGGAEAVEQGALAVPAQDHLRGHQDALPLRVLHHGTHVLLVHYLFANTQKFKFSFSFCCD